MSGPPAPKVAQSSGVDELAQLRLAEQEASVIVNEARAERKAKMRAATSEAQVEIDAYRAARERELGAVDLEADAAPVLAALERETDSEIEAIRRDYEANKDKVLDMLVGVVTRVEGGAAAGAGGKA